MAVVVVTDSAAGLSADLVAELFGIERAGARALGRGQDGSEVIAVGDERDGRFVAAAIYALAPQKTMAWERRALNHGR